jgi:cytochrome c-type biogenesis protein CcmH/NrfG
MGAGEFVDKTGMFRYDFQNFAERFMMMKKAILLLVIVPLLVGSLAAQNECDDAYVKAMTAQSPGERAQLLKDFLAKCGGKGSQYENFANANLALQEFPGKTPADVTTYGEKALAVGGLDDLTTCQLLLVLSSLYSKSGQNLEKAKGYALRVTEVAKAAKAKESEGATTTAAQWNQMIGAGFYALGQAREKGNDAKGAVDAYANSYTILKNPQILAAIKKLGKTLYDAKNYAAAEAAFKAAYDVTKDPEIGTIYAQSVYRSGKEAEALVLFKDLYTKKKSGELAYNIGIILAKQAKTNPAMSTEAIRYLLEASFTYPAQAQQSRAIAENLFFLSNKDLKYNETVTQIQERNKQVEELTKGYNAKFGGKDAEDLTSGEKAEMESILAEIEGVKKEIEKLQASQAGAIAQFNKMLEDTRQRLGVK